MRNAVRANAGRVPQGRTIQFPAPVKGWMTQESPVDAEEQSALILDNFFPDPGVRVRRYGGNVSPCSELLCRPNTQSESSGSGGGRVAEPHHEMQEKPILANRVVAVIGSMFLMGGETRAG